MPNIVLILYMKYIFRNECSKIGSRTTHCIWNNDISNCKSKWRIVLNRRAQTYPQNISHFIHFGNHEVERFFGRSRNKIAFAIAIFLQSKTKLLAGGRTAHLALKLPLNLQTIVTLTYNITQNSGMGKVLQTSKHIAWDECTIAHKKALEAL